MAKNFYEKLKTATQVKLSFNGQTVKVPKSGIRQAKDLALQMVCLEENCSEKDISENPEKYEKKLEAIFSGYLEGYAESVVPAKNAGRRRAQPVVAVYGDTFSENGSFFKRYFSGASEDAKLQKSQTIKSGVFKISDIFVEGVGGIGKRTIEEYGNIKDDDLGMNFEAGIKKPQIQKVYQNRYYFYVVTALIYGFLDKLFNEVSNAAIEDYLMRELGNKSLKELQSPEFSHAFVKVLREKLHASLSQTDLKNILR